MKEEYDVVIVGAGPAGGTASWFTAREGLRVLLVEKKKAVGIPVTCAEALRKNTEKVIPLPDYVIDHHISKRASYRDYVKVSEISLSAYMINRAELDRYLASQAVSEGAELSIGTEFLNFEKNGEKMEISLKKRGKIKKVTCSMLIGADGFGSRVARLAGFTGKLHPTDYSITYQYCMANVATEEDTIIFFAYVPYIGKGYACIFPNRSGIANVGLGMRSRQGASARYVLDLFLRQNPVAHKKCQNAFPLSQSASTLYTSGPLERIVDDHIMIIGEAAGHIHPVTGEGNYFAVAGGKIASEYCIKSFEEQNFSGKFLTQYKIECDRTFGQELYFALEELRGTAKLGHANR